MGKFTKCGARLSYCLSIGPLFWECPHPRALSYTKLQPATTLKEPQTLPIAPEKNISFGTTIPASSKTHCLISSSHARKQQKKMVWIKDLTTSSVYIASNEDSILPWKCIRSTYFILLMGIKCSLLERESGRQNTYSAVIPFSIQTEVSIRHLQRLQFISYQWTIQRYKHLQPCSFPKVFEDSENISFVPRCMSTSP